MAKDWPYITPSSLQQNLASFSMSGKPNLYYFDGRGRAEFIRLICAEKQIPYNDCRMQDISPMKEKFPFGQVPCWEQDGVMYGQSLAIARMLAKAHGLYGKDIAQQTMTDMLVDGVVDVASAGFIASKGSDDDKKKFQEGKLQEFLGKFESLLKKNKDGKGYFVGDDATWADISLFNAVDSWKWNLDAYHALKEHHARVAARPNIAAWLKNRPVSPW